MKRTHRQVLLALGWYDHRLLQGIAAYATEHQWSVAADSVIHEKVIPWGWDGDGVLAWLGAGDDLAHFVASVRKPTVDFSMRRAHLPFARVLQDHERTGQLVAEHFLERGIRHFQFYSSAENWSQVARGSAFSRALQEKGFGCDALRYPELGGGVFGQSEWERRREWLGNELRKASKPVGVFAANGALAVEVQEVCIEVGIQVPEEVSIVGIDDYLLSVGGASGRSISGVDPNLEEQGYQGAAVLDRMMRTGEMPREPLRIAPLGVIVRKSSDLLAVAHQGVARALRMIMDRFAEPIGVQDLARAAGMSARGLHEAFCEVVGMPPGEKLRRVRLQSAKALLAESEEKMEVVAERSGYANLNTFFLAFQKAEKTTPGQFRRMARRGR